MFLVGLVAIGLTLPFISSQLSGKLNEFTKLINFFNFVVEIYSIKRERLTKIFFHTVTPARFNVSVAIYPHFFS